MLGRVAVLLGSLMLLVPACAQADQSTLFLPGAGPNGAYNDGSGLTISVVVRPLVDGQIDSIRFWKASGDAGNHIGKVWLTDGTPLGTATFTGESASGWQQRDLDGGPLAVTAGTKYVVGVFSSAGRYGASRDMLGSGYRRDDSIEIVTPSAAAPVPGATAYANGAAPAFPTLASPNLSNYWVDLVFDHAPVNPTRPGVTGAGPVLVATDPNAHSTEYLTDILRAEGINQHAWTDVGNVGASVSLDAYDTVVLSATDVGPVQVAALTAFVQGGGTLVAMRPDPDLDSLLGVSRTGSSTNDGYLDIDTTQQPGTGLVTDTIQYHGAAEQLTPLAGTRAVATLYSDRTTATPYAAVTVRQVGTGAAVAFAYDLASSIIAQRQGNLAWEGQNRDDQSGPFRSSDFFVGNHTLYSGNAWIDPQPDWVDFERIQIPQADEQQRLFAKLLTAAPAAPPLPRLWYLPRQLRAALVMTGDGHTSVDVTKRVERLDDMSPTGCSLADWECRRGTFYMFTNHKEGLAAITDTAADALVDRGYEWGLHHNTNCLDRTTDVFENDATWGLAAQLATFAGMYPSVAPQRTMRTHCVAEVGWVETQKIGRTHGIRMNVDSYFWPGAWVQDRPGLMTGSAFPMKLTDRDGSRIDVWSANTQITDESGQSLGMTTRTLLDNALDPQKQYFGAFVANMHVDSGTESLAQTVLNNAVGRGVPVISAEQLLDWSDARAQTTLEDTTWDGTALGFTIDTAAPNLDVLVPAEIAGKRIATVQRCDGTTVVPTTATIKGVEQAFIRVTDGRYQIPYGTLAWDTQFACTGVPTTPAGGGGGGGGTGGGGTTTTTDNTTGTTGGTGGTVDQDGVPTTIITTKLTNRWLPRLGVAPCGATLGKPCIMEATAPGLRSTVVPTPNVTRPAGQLATVLVDKRLDEDGRWRQVAKASTSIASDGVNFTWRPAKLAAGIYRLRVVFPEVGSTPAGVSVPSFVRVITPRFRGIVTARYLPDLRLAGCGSRLTRPCPLGAEVRGLRLRVQALPSVTRPVSQRAVFTVEYRTLDGRWRAVATARAPIRSSIATWDWVPAARLGTGLYRVRAKFPAVGRVPAGTSAARYVLLGQR